MPLCHCAEGHTCTNTLVLAGHVSYVLIGAGTASFAAAKAIREADPQAKVTSFISVCIVVEYIMLKKLTSKKLSDQNRFSTLSLPSLAYSVESELQLNVLAILY